MLEKLKTMKIVGGCCSGYFCNNNLMLLPSYDSKSASHTPDLSFDYVHDF
jgi:hypothetical protein